MQGAAIALAACCIACCAPAGAQTVTANLPLSFGSMAAGTGGTVTVTPAGARSRTGAVVLVTSGAGAAAQLTFTVPFGQPYTVVVPTTDVTLSGASSTMTVNGFTRSTSEGAGTGSSQVLTVGATLHVASQQPPGTYTGQFTVTVNY